MLDRKKRLITVEYTPKTRTLWSMIGTRILDTMDAFEKQVARDFYAKSKGKTHRSGSPKRGS